MFLFKSNMSFISIKNLSKSYGDREIISNLSFSLEKGDKLSIIGPSGSGKTTLLKLLLGIETFDSGEIIINHKVFDIKKEKKFPVDKIGMVFQGHHLFPHMNVVENVTLALKLVKKFNKQLAIEKADNALSKVKISKTLYGKLPKDLSGGEKQRVAIARMLVLEPEIMLFDEPTASLDPELISEVLEIMNSLTKINKTMIFVTHEINFAKKISTKIAYLDNGDFLEIDTPEKIIHTPQSEKLKSFLSKIL
tara:strand:- start:162 stop:911 length:750 start_codon:yes stop_codon:yes gene_type:complete